MKKRMLIPSLFVIAESVCAHHNMSAQFDFDQRFTETGVLADIDWRNPHIYLSIEVKNDAGDAETWRVEGPPPGFFRSREIDKGHFDSSLDKTVTIEVSRARDGSMSGLIRQITLADGTIISACPQNC